MMSWPKMMSRRTRIAFTVFGLANIVGVLVQIRADFSFDLLIPGMAIGGAWTIVGLKGGLPLVPTAGPEQLALGLRRIRRRRLVMYLAMVAWLPVAALVMPNAPKNIHLTLFFLTALPPIIAFAIWALSACPQCGQHFFVCWPIRLVPLQPTRCLGCGLRINSDKALPAA